MHEPPHHVLSFGGFTLDLNRGCLFRGATEQIKLRPKSFEVLRYLAENHGRLISKEELISSVWPQTAVTDDSLVQCLIDVRRALGDTSQRLVKTVPRRGYIFEPAVIREDVAQKIDGGGSMGSGHADQSTELQNIPVLTTTTGGSVSNGDRRHKRTSLAILAAVAALLALSAYFVVPRYFTRTRVDRSGSRTPPVITSIAVLPLENLSGDSAQDYFADGMTEALISNLTQIRALKVISRTSAMRYKGKRDKSLPQIAGELNVDAVLEGTVQRSGGHVHVTTRLILAAADSPSWSREYDQDESDVLKLQSEIARAVANEIRIQLTAEEGARLVSARSINPQAHEAYLLGKYYLKKNNEQDLNRAIEYFERATRIVPDYGPAYAGLSDARLQQGWVVKAGQIYKGVESPARDAALKAIALDEKFAEAHNSLGHIKLLYDWNWAGAEKEFKRALELDPGNVDAHIFYGHLLSLLGREAEAIRQGELAVQMDPLSSTTASSFGHFFYRARRYQEALIHQQRAVELEPRNAEAYFRLADVFVQTGKYDQALAAFEKVSELAPEFESVRAGIALVYALTGRQREARRLINGLKADPISLAIVYVALGDTDQAFATLNKAADERSPTLIGLKVTPSLDTLHSDPRMTALLTRVNLPV